MFCWPASLYNLFQIKPTRCTLILSIFISTSLHVSGNYVLCISGCMVGRPDSLLVHETATYGCDDTRGCVMQFWPPDDEHMCSKHVEAWNKLIVKQKFCTSSSLITEINILKCRVSKTSKFILVSFYLNKNFLDILSKNTQISNNRRIRPVGAELIHADGGTDGQIWRS